MVMMGALWTALVVLSLLFLAHGYVSGGSARSLGRLIPRRLESQAKDDLPKPKKAAAKRKFKVYPSAYANMYGSAVCSGKIKPGGKKKKKSKRK